MDNLITILILMPLLGALLIGTAARSDSDAKYIALFTTIATFFTSLALWFGFDQSAEGFQFVEQYSWIKNHNIGYYVGIDGISLLMIMLTTFLMPFCILCSWGPIKKRVKFFMINFLVLEALVIGTFSALDALLFYMFFEAMLIPMYLIIGIWGGQNRIYAAFKFFLYTLAGSLLFLIAIIYLYMMFGTMSIPELIQQAPHLDLSVQKWLWLAMFAAFAVKVPMWPVHTWLPDAHVQAPTAGSVILAGVLLKVGGYGFLRFSLPMLPEASAYFAFFIFVLSVIAIVYASLVAFAQTDMKKLIAYSSIAHMGFVTIGIFVINQQGIEGAVIQMVSHGLVSAALFLCVGVVYDRLHTREIARYGGLTNIMPRYAMFFMLFTMASVALPGTSGFVGEFLVILGAFQYDTRLALLTASGMVLGAIYALWLYRKVMFEKLEHEDAAEMKDLTGNEKTVFALLAIFVLWLGIYPNTFLKPLHTSVLSLTQNVVDGEETASGYWPCNADSLSAFSTEDMMYIAEACDDISPAAGEEQETGNAHE